MSGGTNDGAAQDMSDEEAAFLRADAALYARHGADVALDAMFANVATIVLSEIEALGNSDFDAGTRRRRIVTLLGAVHTAAGTATLPALDEILRKGTR